MDLQLQIEKVDGICKLIENENEYIGELTGYLPAMNQTISFLLACSQDPESSFEIDEQFVLQTLKDILYGIEHGDVVFLIDVLRYGLLEIYKHGKDELKSEELE